MAIGKVVSPGADQEQAELEIAEGDDEGEQRRRDDAGRITGKVMRRVVVHGVAPRFSPPPRSTVEAGETRGDEAHHPGDDDQHMRGDKPPRVPRIGIS